MEGGAVTFIAQSAFGPGGFKPVEGQMAQDSHVLRTIASATAGIILGKGGPSTQTIRCAGRVSACERQSARATSSRSAAPIVFLFTASPNA
jgi:hypothetical protein